jgi:hypothetical protein
MKNMTSKTKSQPAARTKSSPAIYEFTLVLAGASKVTNEMANALYEAGCSDALVGSCDGVVTVDFDREADSFEEAVRSAIADVMRANIGVTVARVEPDDLVTMSEIARRSGRSRESIRLLVNAERGPGGFPSPLANAKQKSPLWSWREVERWMMEKLAKKPAARPGNATSESDVVSAFNAVMEIRRVAGNAQRAPQLFHEIFDCISPPSSSGEGPPRTRKRLAKRGEKGGGGQSD